MSSIEIRGITKSFGSVSAVGGLNLDVRDGEFLTILGPSGCGKTTTIRLIAGYVYPDSGSILVDGQDVTHLPPRKRRFGMVFQNYALFPHMSVAENIAFGLRMERGTQADIDERVHEMLSVMGLEGMAARYPNELSGGQQQRVALARAVAFRPLVLLMDEPLSALDVKLRYRMRIELQRFQEQLKTTTIYVTHDQDEALSMSDRVAVMENGKIVQLGTPAEIYDSPATRFVADFVGRINFLDASVVAREDDAVVVARLNCSNTQVRCRAPGTMRVELGSSITLAVRPEQIDIKPEVGTDGERSGSPLVGSVEKVTYFGSFQLIDVSVGDTMILIQRQLAPVTLGDRVGLKWPVDAARVLIG